MMQNDSQKNKLYAIFTLFVVLLFSISSVFAAPIVLNSTTRSINTPGYLVVNTTSIGGYAVNAGGSINADQLCIGGVCRGNWFSNVGAGNVTGGLIANYIPYAFNSTHYANSVIYTTNGRVGINTTNPSTALHVYSTGGTPLTVQSSTATSGVNLQTSAGTASVYSISGAAFLASSGATSTILQTNGADRVTVDSTGKVGIGTAPATARLTVGNVAAGHTLEFSTGANFNDIAATSGSGLTIYNTQNNWIQFGTSNLARMTIAGGGNVGIGVTAPSEKLAVVGNLSTTTGAVFATTSGSVGVGTNNPTYKLHVIGNAAITGGLAVTGASNATSFNGAGTGLTGTAASLTAGLATALAANGANCAAGSYPVGVDASGAAEGCAVVITDTYPNITALQTSNTSLNTNVTNLNNMVNVLNTSRLANSSMLNSMINILNSTKAATGVFTCPGGQYVSAYSVNSTVIGGVCATPAGGSIGGSGSAGYVAKFSAGTTLANSIIQDDGTNVGIGKAPGSKLDVAGYARFISPNSGTTGGVVIGDASGNPDAAILQFTNNAFTVQYGYIKGIPTGGIAIGGGNVGISTSVVSERLTVAGNLSTTTGAFFALTSGNVAIGTNSAPTYKLTVNGNVGASAYWFTSDEKLKKNIKPLDASSTVSKVMKLNPVTFEWKDSAVGGKGTQIGLVAQDVEKVYPELVHTAADGTKSVEYANLVAPLIETAQSQQKQIDAQQQQINLLRAEIEALKAERK